MSAFADTYENRSEMRRERRGRRCGPGWKPLELVAMILGFIVFWPIGLAIVGFKIWQKKSGYQGDMAGFVEETWRNKWEWKREASLRWNAGGWGSGSFRSSGNSAFDDWRSAELKRLEEERQKLVAAEREFTEFMDSLRRARDREEFDKFMNARHAPQPGPTSA